MSTKIMNVERLEEQSKHIETFINKSKLINKYDGLLIGGGGITNYRIVRAINGELKNIHNSKNH